MTAFVFAVLLILVFCLALALRYAPESPSPFGVCLVIAMVFYWWLS